MGGNEPCHCGSGKHYRDCHGGLDAAAEKVAFVVAGTQKGGTTALASYLFQHPEIGLPRDKEAHFFDKEHIFASGRGRLRGLPRQLQSGCAQSAARRRDADLHVLGIGAATHPRLQPGDEADHAAAQPGDARLFALEHGARAPERSAAVRAGDPGRAGAMPRSAPVSAPEVLVHRPRPVQPADSPDLAPFSGRADAYPEKRRAAALAAGGAGAYHRLPRRRALSAGTAAQRACPALRSRR